MAGIKDYSTTQANNTSLNSLNVGEGMLPSNLNNAIRALMKNTREWFNDSQWVEYGDGDGAYTAAYASATSFTIAGVDVTPIYHEGRRIKLTATTPGTIYGTISSSTFSTNTTINVTWDSGSLSNEAIDNVYIGALSKTNNSLPTGVIATATLADGSVTTIKIADSAVTTAKINDAAVTNAKLGADSVDGSKIADDSIDSEHYVDGSIDTSHIANSQITTAKIADSNVTNSKLATDSVTTAKITNLNVTSGKIADASISNSKIASDAVDGTKIADDSINSEHYADGSIDTQHIADSQITTSKIADSNVTTSKIADSNITTSKINNDAVTADKIADAVIVTNAEASGHTPNDTTFFTTSASDGRYFRQDSSETIDSGDTWSSSDAFIATTAAIDARVIDLVDDVGGFFPIADETNFPNTNPDVNDGAGTIVSIKEMATTRTPSGGTVTISGGTVGGSTVTITGCGSTVLTAGFGVLVETTTTLNTYTFHRLVPKATEVTTVAAISSDITTVAGDTTDIGVVSGLSSDIQSLADIEDGTVATNAISNVGNNISSVVTTASNISGVNSFADRYRVSSSAPTTSLDSGDLYFDTSTNILNVYGASGWQNAGSSVNGTSQRYNYTATSGQTTFSGSDNNGNTLAYDAGYIDVYLNGVKLLNGTDVTVTSGSSVVLASGATTGDVVDIVAYGTFSVASLNADNLDSGTIPDARITGAYTGITNLTMSGDLTVDTNTLFVDASENTVVIGGTDASSWNANADELVVAGASAGGMTFYNPTQTNIFFADGTTGSDVSRGRIQYIHTNNALLFGTDATERMRIDSSGNLLVANTTGSSSDTGHILAPTGLAFHTRDDGIPFVARRNTSDGDIALFKKDGTTVGSIATDNSSNLTIRGKSSSDFSILFGTNKLNPKNYAGTGAKDNAVDLGDNDDRWKDLYLGGGLYVGGTGTANKLDDYEEGTWTPTYVPDSGSFTSVTYASTAGEYTKIGNTVYFTFYIQTNAITVGSASGYVKIGGLPFAPGGGATSNGGGTVINASFFAGDKPFYGTVGGSSEIFLYYSTSSTANDSLLDVSDLGTGGTDNVFQMMGTYITTA